MTGAGIPRVLVTVNARRVLTDYQGHFEFPQFTDAQAVVSAMKPGYSQSSDGAMYTQQKVPDLSAAVEVKLYPNAALTGTVAGPDGLPLSQVPISLLRANYDVQGLRWINSGFTTTNLRGEYRFLIPGGRYRLAVGYIPRTRDTHKAVLPLRFPSDTSSNGLTSWITLSPGERTNRLATEHRSDASGDHPSGSACEPAEPSLDRRRRNGDVFNLNYTPGATPGEYRAELPAGSYTIHVQSDTRDESMYGTSRVTVGDGEIPTAIVYLAPAASLPIEVSADAGSALNGNLNVAQFGLVLHEVSGGDERSNPDIPARPRENRTSEFRVTPGRYRLCSYAGGGGWYVESATYGGVTNLLSSDLVIAAGSSGEPIRLVVGNARGNIRGQVTLPTGVAMAWVYLFPRQPALTAPTPQPTGSDGSFFTGVPPGSYSVAAFAHRLQEDLRDPDTVARLAAGAPTVEITSGTNPAVTLTLSQVAEAPQ